MRVVALCLAAFAFLDIGDWRKSPTRNAGAQERLFFGFFLMEVHRLRVAIIGGATSEPSGTRLHMYQVYFQFCRGKHAERKKVVRSTNVCLPRSTGLSIRENFRLEDENSNTRWIGVQNENSTLVIEFMGDIGQEGGDTTFANLLPDFCPCPNPPLSANQAEER